VVARFCLAAAVTVFSTVNVRVDTTVVVVVGELHGISLCLFRYWIQAPVVGTRLVVNMVVVEGSPVVTVLVCVWRTVDTTEFVTTLVFVVTEVHIGVDRGYLEEQ